ncbi:MAG: aldehyde dehydrogenase [Verrucomicrobiota bacterium]|nr:aldehyde dehydrogenase [Verrucomicrobiota bacterium]
MEIPAMVRQHRRFFQTGATRALEFRLSQLDKLSAVLNKFEPRLLNALQLDLRKSPFQGYATELGLIHAELRHARKHLRRWAAPSPRKTPWFAAPSSGWVQCEPLGVALIMGPWNYPASLMLMPLVSAIAAGNCVVLKPSELAPHTAETIAAMATDTFPEDYVSVVTGGPDVAELLLRERFDKIFFTGSTRIGRLVMAAAARHLTPVTLELGGKCPAIVCADAAIELAARRIVWGKFMNAGQTCVAPDFVLVQRPVAQSFLGALERSLREFYGENPAMSPDYGRIVNKQHFERLVGYLREGKVACGGAHEASDLYIAPTVLTDVSPDSAVMQEEIFGPILPVLEFGELDEALAELKDRPTPLALYVFTRSRQTETRVINEVRSAGVCVNDVVMQIVGFDLPFGGLGDSGTGAYHGRTGFDTFSHQRSIMRRGSWFDAPVRYPPARISLDWLKRAMRFLLAG